jgi:hypothetical protein
MKFIICACGGDGYGSQAGRGLRGVFCTQHTSTTKTAASLLATAAANDLMHGNVNLNNSGAVLWQLRDPGFRPQVPSTSTTPGTSPDEFKPACKSWFHDATANSGFMSEVNFEASVVHH